jgi:histone-lysine N-methyltransferase SETMAR
MICRCSKAMMVFIVMMDKSEVMFHSPETKQHE